MDTIEDTINLKEEILVSVYPSSGDLTVTRSPKDGAHAKKYVIIKERFISSMWHFHTKRLETSIYSMLQEDYSDGSFQIRMAQFLGKLARGLGWGPNPTKVTHVQWSEYANRQFLHVDGMFLIAPLPEDDLDDDPRLVFELILHAEIQSTKYAYSLLRTCTEEEVLVVFNDYKTRIPPLVESCGKDVLNHSSLQKVTDLLREHPSWHVGHLVAYFGFLDALKNEYVKSFLNVDEECEGLYPLHVAVENENEKIIIAFVSAGAQIGVCDKRGNTPLHIAAMKTVPVINALRPRLHSSLNTTNTCGETPFLLAAQCSKLENVKVLLSLGANINHRNQIPEDFDTSFYMDKLKIIEVTKDISHKDLHKGGSLLHWVKTRELTQLCLDIGCDSNLANTWNETSLHVMVLRNRVSCLVTLLSRGANANVYDSEGNTPLHIAASLCSTTMVQALIVFGSDINAVSKKGETARHMAAACRFEDKGKSQERDKVIYLLHKVGAKRCKIQLPSCSDGCLEEGSFNGVPLYEKPLLRARWVMDEQISKKQIMDAIRWQMTSKSHSGKKGRVLCLDGGGIKGLVLTQMLFDIQQFIGCPIHECFDWISGTSTGGFLALMMSTGKSVQNVQSLYYNLKEKVFVGSRPYQSAPLEEILIKEFGEENVMSSIKSPRVMVTSTLADRLPPDLHLFRNYESPLSVLGIKEGSQFMTTLLPDQQKLWHAARSAGAAPTYFSASEKFLDGGLIANNPMLDTLTEIEEWNMAVKAVGREGEVFTPTVVVSLGCGKPPVSKVDNVDITMPSLLEVRRGFQAIYNMFNLLVEQACASEGRIVDRARAWCSSLHIPFFRFNPQLSQEVALDEHNDECLVRMMWEARSYMNTQQHNLTYLKQLLLPEEGVHSSSEKSKPSRSNSLSNESSASFSYSQANFSNSALGTPLTSPEDDSFHSDAALSPDPANSANVNSILLEKHTVENYSEGSSNSNKQKTNDNSYSEKEMPNFSFIDHCVEQVDSKSMVSSNNTCSHKN